MSVSHLGRHTGTVSDLFKDLSVADNVPFLHTIVPNERRDVALIIIEALFHRFQY
jgi:hypothetical protein